MFVIAVLADVPLFFVLLLVYIVLFDINASLIAHNTAPVQKQAQHELNLAIPVSVVFDEPLFPAYISKMVWHDYITSCTFIS